MHIYIYVCVCLCVHIGASLPLLILSTFSEVCQISHWVPWTMAVVAPKEPWDPSRCRRCRVAEAPGNRKQRWQREGRGQG